MDKIKRETLRKYLYAILIWLRSRSAISSAFLTLPLKKQLTCREFSKHRNTAKWRASSKKKFKTEWEMAGLQFAAKISEPMQPMSRELLFTSPLTIFTFVFLEPDDDSLIQLAFNVTEQLFLYNSSKFQIMIESATLKKPTTLSHNSLLEQNKSLKEGEQATAADSETEVQIPSQIDIFNSYIPNLRETLVDQHDVAAKVASNTFSADKLVRMLSNTIKVFKSYSLVTHLKATDKLASQLGQLRRLLRVDRVIMIIRDYCHYFKKKRLSKFEMFLLAFKIMIFAEDLTDLRVFFIQLGALEGQQALGQLRKRIANLYFCECLGWLINYTHEYLRAQSQELKQKNLIIILRYIIDTIISHNQFSKRAFTLDTKITSCLGLCSSLLNLYLIWK